MYNGLAGYESFLKDRRLVQQDKALFYTRWVRRFLHTVMPMSNLSNEDKARHYCDQLRRDGRFEDWQIEQAGKAVDLYLNLYLPSKPPQHSEPEAKPEPKIEADFYTAIERARELLRLRHYSYRTEQTYLEWMKRYGRYVQEHKLDWRTSDAARLTGASVARSAEEALTDDAVDIAAVLTPVFKKKS